MEDKEIIASVLNGKNEDFGLLVDRYSARLLRVCISVCGNTADAEDAVQEAFMDAFRYLASLSDREKFYPWLCAAARRRAYRQIRHRHNDEDIDGMAEILSSDCLTGEEADREERRERVNRALGKLSDKRRIVCELYYFRDLKIGEIAKRLSLPESTVKSRLYDAREYLRKELCDMDEKFEQWGSAEAEVGPVQTARLCLKAQSAEERNGHNKENIAALEEKIKKQIRELTFYYSLNGGRYDERYGRMVKEAFDLVGRIGDKERKQYYLSSVLECQSRAETDEGKRKDLEEQKKQAAESGKNAGILADDLVDEFFRRNSSEEGLKFLNETAFPKIAACEGSPGWEDAEGTLYFWRGRTLLDLDRTEEARKDFETAAGLLEPSGAYQANAVAALREMRDMEAFAHTPTAGFEATAEGLICEDGRIVFHSQPGFSEAPNAPDQGLRFRSFVYYASCCGRVLLDPRMQPGDKLTDEPKTGDTASLTCVSRGETVSVPAGSFDGCLHMRTEAKRSWPGPYTMDLWYAPDVGIVRVQCLCGGETENYELVGYSLTGGTGYLPLARGNRWIWRSPDVPEYVYHDIERTVEYTDGHLTNLAVTSPVTLRKDYEKCRDLDSNVFLSLADKLCDEWKLDEAIGMLKKAVRLNVSEQAVRISLYGIEVLTRFAEYQKKGYRFCPSSIGASVLETTDHTVKYRKQDVAGFGPYRLGKRGRAEDRIFGIKPFRYFNEFMGCLWDDRWAPGYREEKAVDNDPDLKLIFTVEDGGTVCVPAGEFARCRKITLRVDKPADADDSWYFKNHYRHMNAGIKEYWFAPGVGIVKIVSVWGEKCRAECLLTSYSVPASGPDEYLPVQIGNCWEYDEPNLTAEGYRAKAIFRIASGMNGQYLMTASQEFICFRTEEEYNEFAKAGRRS